MLVSYQANETFTEWACSYSGMNGGNPHADLWICGIEYGGEGVFHDTSRRMDYLDYSEDGFPSWGESYLEQYRHESAKWQYIQKSAKLALIYEGSLVQGYREYIHTRLCRADGSTFMMNLYPLNFLDSGSVHWTKGHQDFTGFPNKTAYKAWCMQYRFPRLTNLFRTYQPKALICTGISFEEDFKLAFLGAENIFQAGKEYKLSGPQNKICKIYTVNDGKTRLIITPFFGQGGVMSDNHLYEISAIAKEGT